MSDNRERRCAENVPYRTRPCQKVNAHVSPRPGLFESGSRSRVFPNAHLVAHMFRSSVPFIVNLVVGVAAVAGFLGLVAMLFGFAIGAWIVLLASLPILWARLFFRASQDYRLRGERREAKALTRARPKKVVLRRRTDRITLPGQSGIQGSLF